MLLNLLQEKKMKISIKTRLNLIIAGTTIFIVLLVGLTLTIILKYDRVTANFVDINRFSTYFSQSIEGITQFFITKDEKKLRQNLTDKDKMVKLLDKLEKNTPTKDIRDNFSLIKANFGNMFNSVENEVRLEKNRGLTEDQGIKGNLVSKAQLIEGVINKLKNKTFMVDLLTMRRYEKNYLIRKTQKYIDNFTFQYSSFLKVINNSTYPPTVKKELSDSLKEYRDAFLRLTSVNSEIDTVQAGITRKIKQIDEWLYRVTAQIDTYGSLFERIAMIISIGAGILAVLLNLLLVLTSIKAITNPLFKMVDYIGIISTGDFRKLIDIKSRDELGTLAEALNHHISSLSALIRNILKSMDNLSFTGSTLAKNLEANAEAVKSINNYTGQTQKQIEEQSVSVTQTSSAIEEMTRNIENLSNAINEQASNITESSASIEEMVANIKSVTYNIDNVSDSVSNLENSSGKGREKLNDVRSIITDISKQSEDLLDANKMIAGIAAKTNLLAMNAAIEAAHAGEAGKGFAVVADEIRKLAEDSAQQSKVVGANLTSVKEGIDRVVSSSLKAEDSFADIVTHVGTVSGVVAEIKQALVELSAGGSQVLEALKNMNNITVSVNEGAGEMKIGSEQILEAITNLNNVSNATKENIDQITQKISAINTAIMNNEELSTKNKSLIEQVVKEVSYFKVKNIEKEE